MDNVTATQAMSAIISVIRKMYIGAYIDRATEIDMLKKANELYAQLGIVEAMNRTSFILKL